MENADRGRGVLCYRRLMRSSRSSGRWARRRRRRGRGCMTCQTSRIPSPSGRPASWKRCGHFSDHPFGLLYNVWTCWEPPEARSAVFQEIRGKKDRRRLVIADHGLMGAAIDMEEFTINSDFYVPAPCISLLLFCSVHSGCRGRLAPFSS